MGTTTLSRAVVADAFAVALDSWSPAPGDVLTVTFRTAEPLARLPQVTWTQPGRAPVVKTATALGGGRYRTSYLITAGTGPATLRISGRDLGGGTNVTTRALVVG